MMRWWLDRGVDGFRMDVINMISKDLGRTGSSAGRGSTSSCTRCTRRCSRGATEPTLTVGEMPGVTLEQAQRFTDPARARGRHGLPVRARAGSTTGATQVGPPRAEADRPQALVRALAGGARGARLELAVLEQPRPAAGRLPLRRRLAGAPRALGEDARHDPAPAPRDAVRVPGRGARDDQRALRRDRRVPGHRVAEPLRGGDGRRRRPGRGAGVAADHEPRQRAHADAVGRGAAGGLHHRRAVDPGQRELPHDQRRRGGGGRGLGLPPLPPADRAAAHRAGRRARRLHDAAAGRRARLRVHAPAGRRRAARARQLLGRGGAGRARRPERRARARQLRGCGRAGRAAAMGSADPRAD